MFLSRDKKELLNGFNVKRFIMVFSMNTFLYFFEPVVTTNVCRNRGFHDNRGLESHMSVSGSCKDALMQQYSSSNLFVWYLERHWPACQRATILSPAYCEAFVVDSVYK